MAIPRLRYKGTTWMNLSSLTSEDRAFIEEKYPFHPLDMEDALEKVQRSKIDTYRDYTFLILHFPYGGNGQRIETAELNVFVGKHYLITLHDGRLKYLDELFKQCQENKKTAAYYLNYGPARLLYTIIDRHVDMTQPILKDLGRAIDKIDEEIFTRSPKDIVEKINIIRRNVIISQTMIKPQLEIFYDLEKGKHPFLNGRLATYWANIYDHLLRIHDRLEDYHELIEGLSAANESLLSHRTNQIIKILTIFSVILLPLTLISGIYGMNLTFLPLASHPFSIHIISGFMVSIAVVMLVFFRFKRWI